MSVIFKAENHKYESLDPNERIDWLSVTSFVKNFKQPFDAVAQSIKSSKNPRSKWYGHVGYYSRPEVADWDNDGWQDLVIGSYEDIQGSTDGHVLYVHALSGPYLKSRSVRDGNLNNFLERGETVTITTVLTNAVRLITGLNATLSTTSPW